MNLPDLDHLDKIIQLCRKRGVSSIEIDGVKISLGEPPSPTKRSRKVNPLPPTDTDTIESDSLSEEEMLFWSVGNPDEMANKE